MKTKDEVTNNFKEYVADMSMQIGKKPARLRTDNGREYVFLELQRFFISSLFRTTLNKMVWPKRKTDISLAVGSLCRRVEKPINHD